MLQCFVKKQTDSCFSHGQAPELAYICSTEQAGMILPRLMHRHENTAEIYFMTSGHGDHLIDSRKYSTKSGDILVYNSGVLHSEYSGPDNIMKGLCCGIKNLKLKGLPENHLLPSYQAQVIPSGEYAEYIAALMDHMFKQANNASPETPEICNHLLVSLVLLITQLNSQRTSLDDLLEDHKEHLLYQSIKEYIDQNYMEDISLNSIAGHFNMSSYYLSHLFKECTGYSPIQYIIHRRIGEAQNLLIHTRGSVTYIAGTVGYGNSNYFVTLFSKLVGITPKQYRRYWTENQNKWYV